MGILPAFVTIMTVVTTNNSDIMTKNNRLTVDYPIIWCKL